MVDFETRTVTIGLASNFIEADKIYIAGTCVSADVEMTRTIEDENQYAFHAELQPGTIYFPILFNGQKDMAIAPGRTVRFYRWYSNEYLDNESETAALWLSLEY